MPRVLRVVLILAIVSAALGVILGGRVRAQSTTNPYRVTSIGRNFPTAEQWER